jgi:ABC-2 type transport system ATP-binding protein
MTAAENLDFYGQLHGVRAAERWPRIASLLESVNLAEWRDKRVGTFSGGMRRRLDIVRGLMHHPRILFLDEPTAGLDPASRLAIWDLVARLKQETGLTVFLTTHYMEEADQLCDRVAIFDHGNVVALDTPTALKARLSGSDTIEVSFGPADARWHQALATLPAAVTATVENGIWRIGTKDKVATLDALLARARQAGVTLTTLTVRGSSLDDVFITYTGRALRDTADGKVSSGIQMFYERASS